MRREKRANQGRGIEKRGALLRWVTGCAARPVRSGMQNREREIPGSEQIEQRISRLHSGEEVSYNKILISSRGGTGG